MLRSMETLGATRYKTYRIYEWHWCACQSREPIHQHNNIAPQWQVWYYGGEYLL